jgi:hypothetical protein
MVLHPDDQQDFFPGTYILTCPETAEIQYCVSYELFLRNFFDTTKRRDDAWFWNSFAAPLEGVRRVQHFHPQERPDRKLSLLERLPTELIEVIIDVLLYDFDGDGAGSGKECVLCLAISSPILYPKILSRIHSDYVRARLQSWIGRKVGFHGRSSPFRVHQMQAYGQSNFSFLPDRMPEWELLPEWWSAWKSVEQPERKWHRTIDHLHDHNPDISQECWQQVREDISQTYLYPQDRVWVIRNLTTRQIVRSDALSPPQSITHEPLFPTPTPRESTWRKLRARFMPKKAPAPDPVLERACETFTLPQVFLLMTAYSSKRFFELTYQIGRGPWNAHTFQVLSLSQHDSSTDTEWQDVSASVAADIGHLRWCVWREDEFYQQARRKGEVTKLRERVKESRKMWRGRMVDDVKGVEEGSRESEDTWAYGEEE